MSLALYFDENFLSDARIDAVRGVGFDLLTANEAEMLGKGDVEHLELAASTRRLLVTFDRRDFQSLHTAWMTSGKEHWGILLVIQFNGPGPGEIVRRLRSLEARFAQVPTTNQLLYLSNFPAAKSTP